MSRRTGEVGDDAVEVVQRFVVKLAAAGAETEVDAQTLGVCRQPCVFWRQIAGGRRRGGTGEFRILFFDDLVYKALPSDDLLASIRRRKLDETQRERIRRIGRGVEKQAAREDVILACDGED